MQVSVIIVNYNVRAFLENALIAVRQALSGLQGEVIVVDNASDDGSVEMLQLKFPDVTLIANTRNVGFAAANNQAIGKATGDYLLLLNPDTIVQEDTINVMIDFLGRHPDAGMAGCKILNPDGSLQLACRRSFPTPWVAFTKMTGLSSLFPGSRLFGRYNMTSRDPDDSYEVDAISGSFMFVRSNVVRDVGGLDEQFFMYGEDLDWCYRIRLAGWKVWYVHSTRIIHFKGESARRSDIDEVRHFYQAMRLFVRKHLPRGFFADGMISAGIALREWVAFLARIGRPVRAALLDLIIIDLSLLLGEYIWIGEFFHFPAYGYPVLLTVPWLVIATTMYGMGAYTTRRLSASRVMGSVIIGYVIISALTFFFKQYGFSRMVLGISGIISLIALPGWRMSVRSLRRSPEGQRKSLFGRRTLIVGAEASGQEVLRKLRHRVDDGYDVVGFVDINRKRVGERVSGVEILGSIDNIAKVIEEYKASEVIFSTDILSYGDILSVIGRSSNRNINFRLVPSSLEVIIGKTHIDELDDIPLVQIDYNINRPIHRILKRIFDIIGSLILLGTVFPMLYLRGKASLRPGTLAERLLLLPRVFGGELSLVGPPGVSPGSDVKRDLKSGAYWGKPGVTGLVFINHRDDLNNEEIEKYNVYYAKNQSLFLDLEILLKSFLLLMQR